MKKEKFKDDLRAKLALDDETIKGDISNIKKVIKFLVFGGGFFLAGGLAFLFHFAKIELVEDLNEPLYFTKSLCENEQKTCHKKPVFMWTKKEIKKEK